MIQRKKKLCKGCNKEKYIFSKGYCQSCVPKKPLKKITERGIEKKKKKASLTKQLFDFYLSLWDERADKNGNVTCFETDILMSGTIYRNNICCYSHQIPKSTHPEMAFNKKNVLIVLPDVHANWEANPKSCEKMYEYTQILKDKYKI